MIGNVVRTHLVPNLHTLRTCAYYARLTEVAVQFPRVDCVGIDFLEQQHVYVVCIISSLLAVVLVADQRPLSNAPRNVTFMQVNVPRGMGVLAAGSFDVVHVRQMIYAVGYKQRAI